MIYLSRLVTHEHLQLCWQNALKKRVLHVAYRVKKMACIIRMLKEISHVALEIKA